MPWQHAMESTPPRKSWDTPRYSRTGPDAADLLYCSVQHEQVNGKIDVILVWVLS